MSKISVDATDVLILCGGFGTRFRKVREDIPKALAPIQGTPFIDLVLNDLVDQGFRRFILATGHLSSQLENHVNQRTDAEYIISCEPIPLGTGGAIKFAEKHLRSDQVLILNGDSRINFYFPLLLDFHKNSRADMSILLSSSTKGEGYGNVILNNKNQISIFSEKTSNNSSAFVNSGVYIINRSILSSLKPQVQYSLEKDCLPSWIVSHKIFGMSTDKSVHDIGTPERYFNSQNILFEK